MHNSKSYLRFECFRCCTFFAVGFNVTVFGEELMETTQMAATIKLIIFHQKFLEACALEVR